MKNPNKKPRIALRQIPVLLVVIVLSFFALFPFWSMMVMGTYRTADIYKEIHLWFGDYFPQNWARIVEIDFFRFFVNSIVVALTSSLLAITTSSMAGYVFAKFEFRGSRVMFNFILATMMIPGQLGLIAFIILVRRMGLISSWLPLIIPTGASAFGVFWMRQYIAGAVSGELIESARIDGCSEFGIFLRIVVPMITPALMTLGLLSFLWSWNDFMRPMLILENENLFTIPLGIKRMSSYMRQDIGATILGISVGTIPILILFAFFNNTLVNGLTAGAVKE
ncbi:MAG: carbohydrate ABC transporter permease [Clostridia bacterium]|nr:carbohydrate ABC transporter permease [Clostridia bacterium]